MSLDQKIIICVDDEAIILNSLKIQLSHFFPSDYIIEVAEGGEQALLLMKELKDEFGQDPDIIISDQIMPKMQGDELLRIVSELYPETKAILLTGQAEKDDIVRAIDSNILYRMIEKPWDSLDLTMTISRALEAVQNIKEIKIGNEKLEELNKSLESKVEERTKEIRFKNDQINSSIRYAEKIQDSILTPSKVALSELFPDSFIVYKPLKIVSGDFYWSKKVKDVIYMAVVDCTGHGVPGAFLSILGNRFLDEIVVRNEISDPSEILTALRVCLLETLNPDETQLSDGMDIGLCTLNLSSKECIFAGAFRPLVYIQDDKTVVIKGDRIAIGGVDNLQKEFTNHMFSFEKPTKLYLFTDGVVDQFGGDNGKKMYLANLISLLEEKHQLPMQEQRIEITNSLLEWKGENPQVDDITLIGIDLKKLSK